MQKSVEIYRSRSPGCYHFFGLRHLALAQSLDLGDPIMDWVHERDGYVWSTNHGSHWRLAVYSEILQTQCLELFPDERGKRCHTS